MAGLLLKELKVRGLVTRTLIVAPANLTFQWQRELKDKFREQFDVMRGEVLRTQYGQNPWQERNQVVTSVSWISRVEDAKASLLRSSWDLVIVDEAHKMSAYSADKKTLAFQIGEALSQRTDHLLLMTATPHKGDPENFRLFLSLLDRDVYGDVKSLEEAMRRQEAPFYLRRLKEALVGFPDPETGEVRKLFTDRDVRTTRFELCGREVDRALTPDERWQRRLRGAGEPLWQWQDQIREEARRQWAERLLPASFSALAAATQRDLLRSTTVYHAAVDDLGRGAHLLALTLERELPARLVEPIHRDYRGRPRGTTPSQAHQAAHKPKQFMLARLLELATELASPLPPSLAPDDVLRDVHPRVAHCASALAALGRLSEPLTTVDGRTVSLVKVRNAVAHGTDHPGGTTLDRLQVDAIRRALVFESPCILDAIATIRIA
jgi:hypothetical protein